MFSALWTLLILFFAGGYFVKRWPAVSELMQQMELSILLGAVLAVVFSKLLMPVFMKYALALMRIIMPFGQCFYIYHTSQLAKYLPGNIWHFVSKAGAYRVRGYSMDRIRDALLIENGLLVLGAMGTGLLLTGIFGFAHLQQLGGQINATWWLGIALFAIVGMMVACFVERKIGFFKKMCVSWRNGLVIVLLHAGIWLSLGGMLFMLMLPYLGENARCMTTYFYATGIFALGYSIGFVTPFAPAGIGIREGILVLGLAPYIGSGSTVIIISTLSRLLYVVVEIVLALLCRLTKMLAHNRRKC